MIKVGSLLLFLGCLLAVPGARAAASHPVTLEFSTVPTGGKYSPRHVLAVWVTDANTNFVKTLCRYGVKRQKYLAAWRQAHGGQTAVDGTTGATRKTHTPIVVTWDGCNADGQPLPDGRYYFFVEFADSHQEAPLAVLPIHKGPTALALALPDEKHFTGIRITAPARASGPR
jgi:hypothetical protein